jgi:DNA polymerase I-like protein with 3'-5' exonuclease and polymerase domains
LPLIQKMMATGVRVDLDAAERSRKTLLKERDAKLAELSNKLEVTGVDMEDLYSVPWLAATCDRLGITYPRTAKTGKPSFTSAASSLGWMRQHPHWFPPLVVRAKEFHSAATKFLQTYVIEHAAHGRVYPEIHPFRSDDGGARSSRMSYSHPPLQQMASHDDEIAALVRRAFLPEPGEMWASIDYAQQEFRLIVAEAAARGLTGAHEAAERYRTDPTTDFHVFVAEIANLERKKAKSANFGKAYRAGITKFAALLGGISETEAVAVMEQYDRALPFVSELAVACQAQVERDGYLTLFDGTRRHYDQWEASYIDVGKGMLAPCSIEEARRRIRNPSHPWFGSRLRRFGAYFAMNALIQGNGARLTKKWMLDCWRDGLVPLVTMHDGLEFSVSSPEQAERVAQLGRDTVTFSVPMQVDIKYGRTWAGATHANFAEVSELVVDVIPVDYQPQPKRLASQGRLLREPSPDSYSLLDRYVDMVTERHAILGRREQGEVYPWTSDAILGTWYFTNMSRAQDKVTRWLWTHWCEPHRDDPDLWFALTIARLTNRIETWEALGYPVPWNPEHFVDVMSKRPKNKAYGSAYVIPAFQGDKRPKYVTQAEILTWLWNDRERWRPC